MKVKRNAPNWNMKILNNVITELKHEINQKNEYIDSQEDIQTLVEDVERVIRKMNLKLRIFQ
jgi:hypothetical protein